MTNATIQNLIGSALQELKKSKHRNESDAIINTLERELEDLAEHGLITDLAACEIIDDLYSEFVTDFYQS